MYGLACRLLLEFSNIILYGYRLGISSTVSSCWQEGILRFCIVPLVRSAALSCPHDEVCLDFRVDKREDDGLSEVSVISCISCLIFNVDMQHIRSNNDCCLYYQAWQGRRPPH